MNLKKKEEMFLHSWLRKRKQGKLRYVSLQALAWGLAAVISHLFKVWEHFKAWNTTTLADAYTSSDFFVRALIFIAIGTALGTYYWNFNSKKFSQLKEIQEKSQ